MSDGEEERLCDLVKCILEILKIEHCTVRKMIAVQGTRSAAIVMYLHSRVDDCDDALMVFPVELTQTQPTMVQSAG